MGDNERPASARTYAWAAATALPPLAFAALWEVGLAVPLPLLVYGVYGGLCLAILLALWRPPRLGMAAGLPLVLGLAVLYLVPWTSRKAFVRDLYRIKPGMTEAQADAIMSRYIRGAGWPTHPLAPSGGASTAAGRRSSVVPLPPQRPPGVRERIYRHSNDGAFDSDWGIVSVKDGRVVRVEFSAD